MPSTGTPTSTTAVSQRGASCSDTLFGPPERMMPAGRLARSVSSGVLKGTTSE